MKKPIKPRKPNLPSELIDFNSRLALCHNDSNWGLSVLRDGTQLIDVCQFVKELSNRGFDFDNETLKCHISFDDNSSSCMWVNVSQQIYNTGYSSDLFEYQAKMEEYNALMQQYEIDKVAYAKFKELNDKNKKLAELIAKQQEIQAEIDALQQ